MTIRSMTAFAQCNKEYDWGTVSWEIRAVNQRYLDVHLKLPDNWRKLESPIREQLRKALNRGKVEVSLRIGAITSSTEALQINQALAQQLGDAATALNKQLGQESAVDPLEILKWPGVIQQAEQDADSQQKSLMSAFKNAVQELVDTREREGADLKLMIEQRLESIQKITDELRQKMPNIVAAQRKKLQQKIADLSVELEPERVEAEIVLLAQKADVDEELDRLDTHVSETNRVLQKGGACGRRLDFLMQELNREANTLSSKAIVTDSTQAAVELKVLIEQMREQIQNIE